MARDTGGPWHITADTSWWNGTRLAWCGAVSDGVPKTGWFLGTPPGGWCQACRTAKRHGRKPRR